MDSLPPVMTSSVSEHASFEPVEGCARKLGPESPFGSLKIGGNLGCKFRHQQSNQLIHVKKCSGTPFNMRSHVNFIPLHLSQRSPGLHVREENSLLSQLGTLRGSVRASSLPMDNCCYSLLKFHYPPFFHLCVYTGSSYGNLRLFVSPKITS